MQVLAYYLTLDGTEEGKASQLNPNFCTVMLVLSNLSVAAMDVIVDSIMIVQSRAYPDDGSEELQSFSWACLGMGGVVGSLAAAFLTEKYTEDPAYCFMASSVTALILMALSFKLDIKVEQGLTNNSNNNEL